MVHGILRDTPYFSPGTLTSLVFPAIASHGTMDLSCIGPFTQTVSFLFLGKNGFLLLGWLNPMLLDLG